MVENNILALKKRAALISLIIGFGMLAGKTGGYFITNSAAILSDALESIVHVAATGMAFFSIIISSRPADDTHPYGHGKIEYFSAGIEGLLIIIAAIAIFYAAVTDIIFGSEIKSLDIGIIVVSFAAVINLALGFYLIRVGKKTNSLTLVADGQHILTDSYTSFGVMAGIFLVMITGWQILDPLVAMAIAVNIVVTGFQLLRESFGGLMHETDKKVLKDIIDGLLKTKKSFWIDIHQLRFWKTSDTIFLDFHLILPYYFTIKESHEEEKRITTQLDSVNHNVELKIHFDHCTDSLCRLCKFSECTRRVHKWDTDFVWDEKKLTGPPVYQLFSEPS